MRATDCEINELSLKIFPPIVSELFQLSRITRWSMPNDLATRATFHIQGSLPESRYVFAPLRFIASGSVWK